MSGKLLVVVIRHMRQQLRRTILAALTFAVAVFIYAVLIAVPASMDRIAQGASKGLRLIVTERNNYNLPTRYCGSISKMQHVLGCAPEILWGAIYRDPRDLIIVNGITQDIASVVASTDYQLAADKVKELQADRRKAIVGEVLMREHGWKLGQPITLRNSDSRLTLTFIPVASIPTEYLSRIFYFDRRMLDDAVKKAFGDDIQDQATFLVVRVDRAENMGLVADEIDENFRNSEAETETNLETDSVKSVITAIGNIRPIIYGLCLVVMLTVFCIAGNSMAMMVRDRTGEVAIMRALGFARWHIGALLAGEAGATGLVGAALGAAAALWYFGGGVSLGAITGMLGYMEVRPETAAGAVAVAVMVSVASALVPIAGAVRIEPAAAFRKVV